MVGPFEDFYKEMEKCGFDELHSVVDAKGLCVELNDGNNTEGERCTIMWLKQWDMATLVHETTHLVLALLEQLRIPSGRDNTEVVAYYFEYWYKTFVRAHKKALKS